MLMTGEAMMGLWGALKSVVRAGDVVVSACNGVYGAGIADMAASLGAVVHRVERSDDRVHTMLDIRVLCNNLGCRL